MANAHQTHTHGGYRSPRRTDTERDQRTDGTGSEQEPSGRDDVQAIVDHRRDDARLHPRGTYRSHHEENEASRHAAADIAYHEVFEERPFLLVAHDGNGTYHTRDEYEHNLRRTSEHAIAKHIDAYRQQGYQHRYGQKANQQ